MKNEKMKKIQKYGVKLLVSQDGKVYKTSGEEYKYQSLAVKGYKAVSLYDKKNKRTRLAYVHHLVIQAFGKMKKPRGEDIQIDHINGNCQDNRISNLRWMSRKQNNSRKSKTLLQSKNHVHTSHKDELIWGYNRLTGETKSWENGIKAAKDIGCSHVLIYNVLKPDYPAITAKGWSLMWMDQSNKDDVEILKMIQEV